MAVAIISTNLLYFISKTFTLNYEAFVHNMKKKTPQFNLCKSQMKKVPGIWFLNREKYPNSAKYFICCDGRSFI